jgi:hypothetical protein
MHTFFELLKVAFLATLYVAFVPRLMAIGLAPREDEASPPS